MYTRWRWGARPGGCGCPAVGWLFLAGDGDAELEFGSAVRPCCVGAHADEVATHLAYETFGDEETEAEPFLLSCEGVVFAGERFEEVG